MITCDDRMEGEIKEAVERGGSIQDKGVESRRKLNGNKRQKKDLKKWVWNVGSSTWQTAHSHVEQLLELPLGEECVLAGHLHT